jgi:hypothetical protein
MYFFFHFFIFSNNNQHQNISTFFIFYITSIIFYYYLNKKSFLKYKKKFIFLYKFFLLYITSYFLLILKLTIQYTIMYVSLSNNTKIGRHSLVPPLLLDQPWRAISYMAYLELRDCKPMHPHRALHMRERERDCISFTTTATSKILFPLICCINGEKAGERERIKLYKYGAEDRP